VKTEGLATSYLNATQLSVLALEGGSVPNGFKVKGSKTALLGVLMKRFKVVGLAWRLIEVDGLDGTERSIEIARELPSSDVMMLGGISYAGFNLVDPLKLVEKLGRPVLVVVEEPPNNEAVKAALLKHFPDWKERWRVFEELALRAPVVKVEPYEGSYIYLEAVGLPVEEAKRIVKELIRWGRTPEPLRAARQLVKGVTRSLLKAVRSDRGI
jgi:endonuclease V-like protein UPF0215 family